jgi:hypothetical protein
MAARSRPPLPRRLPYRLSTTQTYQDRTCRQLRVLLLSVGRLRRLRQRLQATVEAIAAFAGTRRL